RIDSALYCVNRYAFWIPLWTQLESVKSIIRNTPPKETSGFAFDAVNGESRLPWPPARTRVSVEPFTSSLEYMEYTSRLHTLIFREIEIRKCDLEKYGRGS